MRKDGEGKPLDAEQRRGTRGGKGSDEGIRKWSTQKKAQQLTLADSR